MSSDLKILVVGHSLRRDAQPVVSTALRLAARLGARTELVHGYTPTRHEARTRAPAGELLDAREVHHRIQAELAESARRHGVESDRSVGRHCVAASPAEALESVASSLGADLIVIGPKELSPLERGALGSTVEALLRSATFPVLIVKREQTLPPQRVLAAVDLSALSVDAFRCAERLLEPALRESGGSCAEIELLTVLDRAERQEPLSDEQLEEFVAGELAGLAVDHGHLDADDLDCEVRRGDPAEEILEEVERRGVDLLILGSQGAGHARRLERIGEVAGRVAAAASCNVLVVPPEAAWIEAETQAVERATGRRRKMEQPRVPNEEES